MIREKTKRLTLLCVFIFASSLLLCSLFINTHDDFFIPDTGTDLSGSFRYALTMGNGRYLGNILGTFLTVRYLPNLIVRSLVLSGAVLLLAAAFTDFSLRSLILSALLLTLPGVGVYAQAYQWAHGFYNYVPPLLPLLGAILILRRSDDRPTAFSGVLLFLFGVIQSLFAENITVVCDIAAVYLFLSALLRRSDSRRPALSYLAGSLLGTAVMFIGPKLSGVSGTLGWYRGVIGLSDAPLFISRMTSNLIIIARTLSGWYILFALMFALLAIRQTQAKRRGCGLLLAVLALSGAVMTVMGIIAPDYEYLIPPLTLLIVSVLVSALCAFVLVCLLYDRDTLLRLLLPVLAAAASVGELLFVQPIGPRCLFVSYLLLCASAVILAEQTFRFSAPKLQWFFDCAASVSLAILFLTVLFLQFSIFKANRLRMDFIEEQFARGETDIFVSDLPYPGMIYNANGSQMFKYTYHYGDPEEMVFTRIAPENLSE